MDDQAWLESWQAEQDCGGRMRLLRDAGQVYGQTWGYCEAQGHVFKLSCRDARPLDRRGGGVRGCIYGVSEASRKRLFEAMARLDVEGFLLSGGRIWFATLTFPKDFPDDMTAKAMWRRWVKRLKRLFPTCEVCGIWRMEHQSRGAPHFHCLLFGVPCLPPSWVRWSWGCCIGYAGCARLQVDVKAITDWEHCFNYVGKYVAKAGSEDPSGAAAPALPATVKVAVPLGAERVVPLRDLAGNLTGEVARWSPEVVVSVPAAADVQPAGGPLDSVTYRAASMSTPAPPPIGAPAPPPIGSPSPLIPAPKGKNRADTRGRVWGWVSKGLLPRKPLHRYVVKPGSWVRELKGMCNLALRVRHVERRGAAERSGRTFRGRCFQTDDQVSGGFTFLTGDAARWLDMAVRLSMG